MENNNPVGAKVFKIGSMVQASPEGKSLSALGNGIKMRVLSIIDERRVKVQIITNPKFTTRYNHKSEKTTVHYEKDVLKRFEFIIDAQYLGLIKTKTSSSGGFGF